MAWTASLTALIACAAFGQSNNSPAFEAASIKVHDPQVFTPTQVLFLPGGKFTANNVPLFTLIQRVYSVESFQVFGRAELDQGRKVRYPRRGGGGGGGVGQ
jgi:hypothetical protein